jgi:signal transduction histidine kinase
VVVAVVIAAVGIRTFERSLHLVTHTREVREHLSIVLSTLLDAESAQRGYLLAQDDSYTDHFVSAKSRIPVEEEDRLLRERSQQAREAMRWVLIAIYATGLSAIGLIGLVRYLTNTERREQAARHRQLTEQARLLDLSRDAIIVRDATDRVRYWSQGAIDLYGYSREDALGRVTHDLTRNGRKITTLSSWTLDRDDTGGVRTILEANNDMTARKIAEMSLRRSNEDLAQLTSQLERRVSERTRELSEANSELESFARSVAHDLREPLRTMQGFSTALIQDYAAQLPAEGLKFATHIATAAQRMDQQILDLLTYSRLSRETTRIESIALDEVMHTVRNELAEDLQRTGGHLTIDVEPLLVRANRTLLTQVLSNLVANALEFVPAETRAHVRVSANAADGRVRVCVADKGIGIAPQDHERIFGVFERLHGYETYPGTGMGLAIVRRAVERMGGTLGVISELGQGSRFWFELERGAA